MRVIGAVVASLRPKQWVKNLFVFAGVIFSQQLFTPLFWPALGAFALFCALSGAMYLLNDVADAEKDRLHPTKRHRPVAAGRSSGHRRRPACRRGGLAEAHPRDPRRQRLPLGRNQH